MGYRLKAALAVGLGLSLAGSPVQPDISPEILAALDPSRAAASLCMDRDAEGSLARRLLIP